MPRDLTEDRGPSRNAHRGKTHHARRTTHHARTSEHELLNMSGCPDRTGVRNRVCLTHHESRCARNHHTMYVSGSGVAHYRLKTEGPHTGYASRNVEMRRERAGSRLARRRARAISDRSVTTMSSMPSPSSPAPDASTLNEPLTYAAMVRALLGDVCAGNYNKVKSRPDDHYRQFLARSPMLFIRSTYRGPVRRVAQRGRSGFRPHAERHAYRDSRTLGQPPCRYHAECPGESAGGLAVSQPRYARDAARERLIRALYRRLRARLPGRARQASTSCYRRRDVGGVPSLRACVAAVRTQGRPDVAAARIFADHMAQPDLTCNEMETVLDDAYHGLF